MNSDNSSPYLQNVSPVNPSLSPHWIPPSVQIPVYPVIPDITQKQVIPTTQKQRYDSYDMVKVVLRNQPTSVYCPSCKLNIMTVLKGRRITLLYYTLLFSFFVLFMIWVLDEFEDDRLYIIMGFVTLCILSGVIAYNIYLVSFYHACPLCGLSIGKCGDIGYRQVPAE